MRSPHGAELAHAAHVFLARVHDRPRVGRAPRDDQMAPVMCSTSSGPLHVPISWIVVHRELDATPALLCALCKMLRLRLFCERRGRSDDILTSSSSSSFVFFFSFFFFFFFS
eukprot:TRINITY_DN2089_c0_g7_i1.p2 TRINITY_DN2089_c0_g7~~TRINITY_DN2089_c0_g7_i1.p2  ORF type:complete len:112 (-),score=29.24 TRINITY_DN2089_c0_g7_i1:130-465(-)